MDRVDAGRWSLLVPGPPDRLGYQGHLRFARAVVPGREDHLGHDRGDGGDVVLDVDDVGERVETDLRLLGEVEITGAAEGGHLLVAPPDVDHPDLGVHGVVVEEEVVEEEALAAPGGPADEGVVVVDSLLMEDIEPEELSLSGSKEHGGPAEPGEVPLDRQRHGDGVNGHHMVPVEGLDVPLHVVKAEGKRQEK